MISEQKDKTPRELVGDLCEAENTRRSANAKWYASAGDYEQYQQAKQAAQTAGQVVSTVRSQLQQQTNR